MIIDKSEFIESLSDEECNEGLIRFGIEEDGFNESVWGYATPEDKAKCQDRNFYGEITAILLNQPLCYFSKLHWGCEVKLKCCGGYRPELDQNWIKENVFEVA